MIKDALKDTDSPTLNKWNPKSSNTKWEDRPSKNNSSETFLFFFRELISNTKEQMIGNLKQCTVTIISKSFSKN